MHTIQEYTTFLLSEGSLSLNEFTTHDAEAHLSSSQTGLQGVVSRIKDLNADREKLENELHRATDPHARNQVSLRIQGIKSALVAAYAQRKHHESVISQNEARLKSASEFSKNHPKF